MSLGVAPEQRFAAGMANPLRASMMYPPARALFAPHRVARPREQAASALGEVRGPLGLYLHVPFCKSRCAFCDYATLPLPREASALDAYVDALEAQIEAAAGLLGNVELTGIDLGGGTPAVLSARHFERLLGRVKARLKLSAGFGVSTETTPALARDREKWCAIARAGVSRVSIGLQEASPELLRSVGRDAGSEQLCREGIEALREAGIGRINLDLMFALPGQTFDGWRRTLDAAVALGPDAITTYDTVYKNRSIALRAFRDGLLPKAEDFGALYDLAFERLMAVGYSARYGSVTFQRAGGSGPASSTGMSRYLESRVLEGRDYLGLGLYASSMLGRTWSFAPARLEDWLAQAGSGAPEADDCYLLPVEHVMAKHLLLSLTCSFLDAERFRRRFGEPIENRFGPALSFLVERALLRPSPEGWELTPGSFAMLPGIRACFYAEEALPLLALPVPEGAGSASPR